MTEKEYRSHPAISRSELFKLKSSPEKFRYCKDNPIEATPALLFGQVVHKVILQPESFNEDFVIMPKIDKRTKAGKEAWMKFVDEAGDKTVVEPEMMEKALAIRDAVMKNPLAVKLLAGEKETPFFWTDALTGEQCKCRTDCITELNADTTVIVDLKTATMGETEKFGREALNYGYDFQAAMYSEGVRTCTGKDCQFVFLVVEKEPPYAVNILLADDDFVAHGFKTYRELLNLYHECKETNNWWGYMGKESKINTLTLPPWAK